MDALTESVRDQRAFGLHPRSAGDEYTDYVAYFAFTPLILLWYAIRLMWNAEFAEHLEYRVNRKINRNTRMQSMRASPTAFTRSTQQSFRKIDMNKMNIDEQVCELSITPVGCRKKERFILFTEVCSQRNE